MKNSGYFINGREIKSNNHSRRDLGNDATNQSSVMRSVDRKIHTLSWTAKKANLEGDVYTTEGAYSVQKNLIIKTQSLVCCSKIEMETENLELMDIFGLAMDIAFQKLIFDHSIVVRCSCIVLNSQLYLFIGESGSGKSTIAREAFLAWPHKVKIIADDHVCLTLKNEGILSNPSIWDSVKVNPYLVKSIHVFELGGSIPSSALSSILARSILLFGFEKAATKLILDILSEPEFDQCSYSSIQVRNYKEALKQIEEASGG